MNGLQDTRSSHRSPVRQGSREGKFPGDRGKQRRGIVSRVFFFLCLILPSIAVYHIARNTDWLAVLTYLAAVSGLTYFLYRGDKKAAQEGRWRTPESTLHLAELAGGWPGAFFAQRMLRHKTSKVSYQVTYWVIVLFHQFLAAEYFSGWKLSRRAFMLLSGIIDSSPA